MDVRNKKYFFNGQPYSGDAAFIQGYNGYTYSVNHGLLCALIPDGKVRSCWDKNGNPNALQDEEGHTIVDFEKGSNGLGIEIYNGNFIQFIK